MIEIRIDEKFLENCGGGLLDSLLVAGMKRGEEISLLFPQSSFSFKQQNGGPRQYLVQEYSVLCLVKDVLHLRDLGYKIHCREIIED